MKHIGFVKPAQLVALLNVVGAPAVVAYLFSMLIYPFSKGDWTYVQGVWDRWQGLNIGMLAFASSITAFNISRFNAHRQQQRNFRAAKAFLPASLSELADYFEASASILVQAWRAKRNVEFGVEVPKLPESNRQVFERCIMYAEPDVGDHLSSILADLQIHDSRLRGFVNEFRRGGHISPDRHNLIVYLYQLGKLQTFVNKLFEFSRSTRGFDSSPLSWEGLLNSYLCLDIPIEEIHIDETMNLEAFTKRRLGGTSDTAVV